jgi:hypothetical protein
VVEGGILEITSVLDSSVEGVKWNGLGRRLVEGAVVTRGAVCETLNVPINDLRKSSKIWLMEDMPKGVKSKARRVRRLMNIEIRRTQNSLFPLMQGKVGSLRVLNMMKSTQTVHGERG